MSTKPCIELSEHEFLLARVELLESWNRLENARDRFAEAVKGDARLPAWCEGHDENHAARAAAVATYTGFYYSREQSPKTVRRLIGLIGVSRGTIRLAEKLNREKRAFASCLARLQNCLWIDERRERHPLVRSAFRQIKIARINTLQATRQVVVVEPGVTAIRWCLSSKPRTKRVSREEAIRYIRDDPDRERRLQRALAKLQRLPPKTPLARYRTGSVLAIANATYINKWFRRENRQYTSGMPLLIALEPGESLPPCEAPRRERTPRHPRPALIERTPFVEELKLHRYREPPPRLASRLRERPLAALFRGP